jgi:hypothetical protein
MKKTYRFSKALVAFAVLVGWKAQAELREVSREQLTQANVPNDVISKLLDTKIILVGRNSLLCFDDGNATEKSAGDQELLSCVELLRQLTEGSSVVESCSPGMMQMGSQGIGAAK